MLEILLEEGYLSYLSDLLLQLDICHFCHDYCVHDMPLSSTCVLLYVLPSIQRCNPCIFVICVVTCASLQSGALANSIFKDLVISLSWDCLSHDAICSCRFLVIRASFEEDQ